MASAPASPTRAQLEKEIEGCENSIAAAKASMKRAQNCSLICGQVLAQITHIVEAQILVAAGDRYAADDSM